MGSPSYNTNSVTSRDGTTIGYRQLGQGPGIILIHGTIITSQELMTLAEALSDSFTVYLPDRRGYGGSRLPGDTHTSQNELDEPPLRGGIFDKLGDNSAIAISPKGLDDLPRLGLTFEEYADNYTIQRESEDVAALCRTSGASTVFGYRTGGVLALQSARTQPAIRNVAAYEPPLFTDYSDPIEWITRIEQEIAQDKLAESAVTIGKRIEYIPRILRVMPRFVVVPPIRYILMREIKKMKDEIDDGEYDIMRERLRLTVQLVQNDLRIAQKAKLKPERFSDIQAEMLLLGRNKSITYLREALDALSTAVPHATRIESPDLDSFEPDISDESEHIKKESEKTRSEGSEHIAEELYQYFA